jgi:hypothetical protein
LLAGRLSAFCHDLLNCHSFLFRQFHCSNSSLGLCC